MAKIICLAQSKGGTSKTSSVINIAACLVQQGYKVLAVDLDMQANLTTGLGIDPANLEQTMHALLTNPKVKAEHIVVKTQEKIDLLPADVDLSTVEFSIKEIAGREKILARKLRPFVGDYDFCLIDTPPSFAITTLNALSASDLLLSPIQPEPFCLRGMKNLIQTFELIRDVANPYLEMLGVFITLYQNNLLAHRELAETIRQDWGDKAFETVIRRRSGIEMAEATAIGRSIVNYKPSSDLAHDYSALTKEIVNRVQA